MENLTDNRSCLLPDFLIIGAGKSGTTSLDNYLRQHPGLFLPPLKEPNFFGYEMKEARDFEDDNEELVNYNRSVTDIGSYLSLFEGHKPGQLKGETSNSYLYHPDAPARIKHYIPHVKLIAILRQPAERLWSRYLHLARDNRLPSASFSDCLDKKSIWWRRNDLVAEGFYFKNLSRFYSWFPESQIRVYLFEEFNKSGEKVLKDIFEFLEVDPTFEPNLSVHFNESGFIKYPRLNKIIGINGVFQRSAKFLLGKHYVAAKESLFLQKLITRVRKQNLSHPGIDENIRKALSTEVYGDDIRQLQGLLKKDLSKWLA